MESRTIERALMPAAPATPEAPDSAILAAFARWQALHAERKVLPETGNFADDDKVYTVEERTLWNAIDVAETAVHDLPAVTPAGIACKLWISIPHITDFPEPEAAAFLADLDWFEAQSDSLNWDLRCIVSALVALKAMEACA